MNYISKLIASKLSKYIPCDESDNCAIYYGINMAIYTLISTIGLFLIGCLFKMPVQTLLLIMICYTNQTLGGGYHASTHLKCFLTMSIALVISLLVLQLSHMHISLLIFDLVSVIILLIYPIVLHPNRYYLTGQIPKLAFRSRFVIILETLVYGFLLLMNNSVVLVFSLALILSATSRVVGKLNNFLNRK